MYAGTPSTGLSSDFIYGKVLNLTYCTSSNFIEFNLFVYLFHLLSLYHKILYYLLYVYFVDNCGMDEYLVFTFRTLSDATCIVYEQFATIVQ